MIDFGVGRAPQAPAPRSGGAPRCRCGSSTCRRNCTLQSAQVPVQLRRVNASSHALPLSLPRCCSSAAPAPRAGHRLRSLRRLSRFSARPGRRPGLGCRHGRFQGHRVGAGLRAAGPRPCVAARTDTPFNADGLTQTITAAMVLRCAEERRLSLDDSVATFGVASPEPDASIRQLLTHTSGAAGKSHIPPSTRAAGAALADRSPMRG